MKGRGLGAVVAGLVATGLLFCAKKMIPPSPDRFAPRLVSIEAPSRVRVELEFDEPLDVRRLAVDSIAVRDAAGGELEVRGVSRGRRPERLSLWTATQSPVTYEVSGMVWDMAGNAARFRRVRFKGSQRIDTIPPRVTRVQPEPGATRVRPLTVVFRFSEAVDTIGVSRELIVPAGLETLFSRVWEPDWQAVGFVCRDSVPPGTVQYILLPAGTPDLEGNRAQEPAFTYFTTDSVMDALSVKGRVTWSGGRLGTGVVLFADSLTRALAAVLSDGSFSCRVRAGTYSVFAVADTNSDGLVDLVSPERQFSTGAESVELFFAAESTPRPLNAYCR
uniref:SbsA Ig-like domain-containing protein n=1 Tax=candidate division WOR-3 bacterium TaxID=2052148 RepID=A0A7C4CB73_UNCW3